MRVWIAGKIGPAVVVKDARRRAERAQGAGGACGRKAGKRIDPGVRIEIGACTLLEIDAGRYRRSVDAGAGGNQLGRADEGPAATLYDGAVGVVEHDQADVRVRGVLDPVPGNAECGCRREQGRERDEPFHLPLLSWWGVGASILKLR